ncbi:hypothetical protein Barb4_04083 [Bacteroidales bacterium Barb4]|nr:hypothetical protein Barb4_04083 [Bacteroidales bacterium Barb4]
MDEIKILSVEGLTEGLIVEIGAVAEAFGIAILNSLVLPLQLTKQQSTLPGWLLSQQSLSLMT